MRIGEVSEATGVNIRLLRYYEERGLLRPNRTPAGQRVFNNDAVDRVQQIRKLLSAGLNTDRIRDLLPCLEAPRNERTPYLTAGLYEEHAKLETTIGALRAAQLALEHLIETESPETRITVAARSDHRDHTT